MLMRVCFPSILSQTHADLEWIVVNDGADPKTRLQVQELSTPFPIRYMEMSEEKGGLCQARNLALAHARAPWVTYLDDDNSFEPEFVDTTLRFLRSNPYLRSTLVQQRRHRDLSQSGVVVRQSAFQVQPRPGSSVDALLLAGRGLFDCNGFVHAKAECPKWNPAFRVFADYEFFLSCLSQWGSGSFSLLDQVLLEYFQSPQGVVGSSNYSTWEWELRMLWEQRSQYPILQAMRAESWLPILIEKFSVKAHFGTPVRLDGKTS